MLEADKHDGIFYQELTFDSVCFDIESNATDPVYLEKVYRLATVEDEAWKDLVVSEEAVKIFEMRERNGWQGPDSVYDAWLLTNENRRSWFDYDLFHEKYPDYGTVRDFWVNRFNGVTTLDEGEEQDQEEEERKDKICLFPAAKVYDDLILVSDEEYLKIKEELQEQDDQANDIDLFIPVKLYDDVVEISASD